MKILSIVFFTFFLAGCVSSSSVIESQKPSKPMAKQCGPKLHGQTREAYEKGSVSGDEKCVKVTQTCINGFWSGPASFPHCFESSTKSCGSQPHGSIKSGYLQAIVHKPMSCAQGTQTCVNGQWVGPVLHKNCQIF